jgi:hypothetical protein
MYYQFPGANQFDDEAKACFEPLISVYAYKLVSWDKQGDNNKIIYENEIAKRRIAVENSTGYTNYGYAVFIYNLQNGDYNHLYFVPWEIQDLKCEFLKRSAEILFNDPETIEMIKGISWYSPGKTFYQK